MRNEEKTTGLTVIGGGTTQTISFPNGTSLSVAFTGKNNFFFNLYCLYLKE
jgi:hypothetical protein